MATPKHLPGDVSTTNSILEAAAMHQQHHRRGEDSSVNNSSLPTPVVSGGTVSEIPELQSTSVFGWNPLDPVSGGAEWHDFTGGGGQNPVVQVSSWNGSSSDYPSGYHQDHHHHLHHGGGASTELQFQTAGGEISSTNNLCSSTTGFSMSYHQNASGDFAFLRNISFFLK